MYCLKLLRVNYQGNGIISLKAFAEVFSERRGFLFLTESEIHETRNKKKY